MFQRTLASILLALVTLTLCGFALEGVLRLTGTTRSPSQRERLDVYRPSGKLSHELRRDWQARFAYNDFDVDVRTNSLGFRGPEVAQEKPEGRLRILVVGDSYAFGWGVEEDEMLGSVLQRELEASGVPAEVISTGVPGYSTDQHLLFLRERGFALDPDLILIAVCENDTHELAWKELALDDQGVPTATTSRRRFINRRGEMRFLNPRLYELPALPMSETLRSWLVDHSWAYGWLRIRMSRAWAGTMERFMSAREALDPDEVPTGPVEALSADAIARGLRGSEAFRLRYHRFLFEKIEADASKRGVPLRTVLIQGAEAGLREDCARSRCLDLTTVFHSKDDPTTRLPNDGHWSARGHRLAAEAIAAWLARDPELAREPQ